MDAGLLTRHDLAGPYHLHPEDHEALKQAAKSVGIPLISPLQDASGFWASLASALHFPAHFGANFDALYDCLCDRSILPNQQIVLLLTGPSALNGLSEDDRETLLAVLQAAADEWREQGRCLWSLFDAPSLNLIVFQGSLRV